MRVETTFFEELQRAIARGFTLAAVSMAMSCGTAVKDPNGQQLVPPPEGAIACTGDAGQMGPFYGACCTNLHCYTPSSGTCAATLEPIGSIAVSPPLPPGSGTCTCGPISGPFAQADGGNSECCYAVGSIGCTGRPLREGTESIVAAVVLSSDWIA